MSECQASAGRGKNVPSLCPWVPASSRLRLELCRCSHIQISVQVNKWVGIGAVASDYKFQDKDKEGTAEQSGGEECTGVE